MNLRTQSRLTKLEAACCAAVAVAVVIVLQYQDGQCLAQGEMFPNLEQVRGRWPEAFLIVGNDAVID